MGKGSEVDVHVYNRWPEEDGKETSGLAQSCFAME